MKQRKPRGGWQLQHDTDDSLITAEEAEALLNALENSVVGKAASVADETARLEAEYTRQSALANITEKQIVNTLIKRSSGMPVTWIENREHSGNFTTVTVYTLRLIAIRPQESSAKPPSTVLISTIFSGGLIAANYFSCLLPPE